MLQSHTQQSDSKVPQGIVTEVQLHQLLAAAQDGGDVEAALMGQSAAPQPQSLNVTAWVLECLTQHPHAWIPQSIVTEVQFSEALVGA